MATFVVSKASEADRLNPLAYGAFEEFVKALKKGQVAKLSLATSETEHGVILPVRHGGKRLDKAVDAWIVAGTVYFRV